MTLYKYTPEDALAIRRAIQSGDLHHAIRLHRAIFPPFQMAYMHDTDESDLQEYLQTPLPVFSFCADEELRELRLRMAIAICLRTRPESALAPDAAFPWPYPMSLKAAAQNFFQSIAIHRNASAWLKNGHVVTARILNSADGPCSVCSAAAKEYTLRELPQLPLHNCENINTVGCRCSVVATKITGALKGQRAPG
jgi:hypothetical protein